MRIAVIGCGSIGRRHVRDLLSLGERDIHIFDYDITVQERLIAERQVTVYVTLRDLYLAKPAVALICTPPEYHIGQALEAVRNGCHVFIEKPLSCSLDSAGIVAYLLKENHLIGHVAAPLRFHPGPLTIKRWLDDGAIGDVLSARLWCSSYLPDWHPERDYRQSYSATTGAVLDVGSHEADVALWLLGPAKLKAAAVRPATSIGLGCDGLAELLLEHDSGAVSSVHVDFVTPGYSRGLEIVGTKGQASWDFSQDVMRQAYVPGFRTQEHGNLNAFEAADAMYRTELGHFLECVRENKPTVNPVWEAAKVLRILLEAKG